MQSNVQSECTLGCGCYSQIREPHFAETKLREAPISQQTHTLHPEGLSTIQTQHRNRAAVKEKDHLQNVKGHFRRMLSEEKIKRMTSPKTRQA